MPIYEYECRRCGHRFDRLQKFSDSPARRCPECGGRVDRLLGVPALHFVGSGWYVTDYARKDARKGGEDSERQKATGDEARTEAGDGSTSKPTAES